MFSRVLLTGPSAGTSVQLSVATPGSVTLDFSDVETAYVVGADGGNTFVFTVSGAVATSLSVPAGAGNDSVRGSIGADTLKGEAGNDSLDGWAGNDLLIGDDGHDRLIMHTGTGARGGAGDDVFVVGENIGGTGNPLEPSMNGGDGDDRVVVTGTAIFAPDVSILGVETLAIGTAPLVLSAAQLDAFDRVVYNGVAPPGAASRPPASSPPGPSANLRCPLMRGRPTSAPQRTRSAPKAPTPDTMPYRGPYPWRPDPHHTASGKPGAVHYACVMQW